MNKRWQKVRSCSYFTVFVVILLNKGALSNNCISKQTCGECIAEGPLCTWCWSEDLPEKNATMCDHKENLDQRKCKIVDPENKLHKNQDDALSDKGTKEEDAVQIKPQEITIQLRPNSVMKFYVEFHQARDYPVDLYYLMDLSNSMRDDKEKLAQLGNKLAAEMGNITSNFRLGFGSFVDKTVAPYVNSHEDKLLKPCDDCAPPYGYQNNMPLSIKTEEFAKEVRKAPISGNLDAPEGGFDAIMQAIVCKKEIGWRNQSRKLLLFSTDNSYHYAGDGKLGGIVVPNDEGCHLDEQGSYTMSTKQDYPSISQINRQIREHKINLIFAVTSDQSELYNQLSQKLDGWASMGTLDKDSGNVVDLVREQYNKIRSEVKMTDDVNDNNIRLVYKSKCLGTQLNNTNICTGLQVGTTVVFEIEMSYVFCPSERRQWNKTFHIFPVGLNDQLTVNLQMMCECDCEKQGSEEADSPKCSNGNGTFECGICNCNRGRYGKLCECDATQTPDNRDAGCFNTEDTKPCSGVGSCRCGQCECNPRQNPEEKYSGKYCECNNFSCDKHDGKICSGPEHGICICGKCKCQPGWKGDDCSCRDSVKSCMDNDGNICSGRGKCICGSCHCDRNEEESYYGTHCDDCATCPGKCNELKDCVERWLENQHGSNTSFVACEDVTFNSEDKIEVKEKEKLCAFEDKEQCRYSFKYAFDEKNKPTVYIKKAKDCPVPAPLVAVASGVSGGVVAKDCPEPVPVVAIVSGVSGGVVATGLFLLMLWKVLTTIHDRRELARFEKERLKAKWNQDDNPIYVGATSTFQNPAYRGE